MVVLDAPYVSSTIAQYAKSFMKRYENEVKSCISVAYSVYLFVRNKRNKQDIIAYTQNCFGQH